MAGNQPLASGKQNYRDSWKASFDFVQQGNAIHSRHLDITDNRADMVVLLQSVESAETIVRFMDLIPRFRQNILHNGTQEGIIIDNQNIHLTATPSKWLYPQMAAVG